MTIQTLYPDIKPTLNLDFANTEKLDGRITFTRASAARYYGTQTAKAEENLLLQSQAFNNPGWIRTNVTVLSDTAVTTAPDATNTADKIEEVAITAAHFVRQDVSIVSGQPYVFSIFAKAAERDVIRLQANSGGAPSSCFANFNLTSGTIGTTGGGATAAISSVGNGWYRCQITLTATSSASTQFICNVTLLDTDTQFYSYLGVVGNGVFLWGAQLEQRSAVTAYTATTTQPITNYIPVLLTATDNVARFDHNPTTSESLGLLVEEQRTNLLTYSSQFDDAAWTKSDCSITSNTIVAPDGTLTGDKVVENTATASHFTSSNAIPTSGSPQVFSVYAKAAEQTKISLAGAGFTGQGFAAIFNLATGTMEINTGSKGTITSVGNGWYRCSIAFTPSNTVPYQIQLVDASNNITYTGNGYSGVFIWGAQLEAGGFATSYIPTVASQVTRSSDAASMTGANFSSWYSQGEGTVYIENTRYRTTGFPSRIRFSDGTANNSINMFYDAAINSSTFAIDSNGTSTVNIFGGGGALNTSIKSASAWKTNDAAVVYNGSVQGTDTSCAIPSNINQVLFGNGLTGVIRKLAYYPVRCTNAQLQALTS